MRDSFFSMGVGLCPKVSCLGASGISPPNTVTQARFGPTTPTRVGAEGETGPWVGACQVVVGSQWAFVVLFVC